jgi:hypothetical protein
LAVGYLLLVTFPGGIRVVGIGLDNSWIFAINTLPHADVVWGRDIAFTWGPLGHLLHPMPIGTNVARSILFGLVAHGLFAVLVVLVWRQGGRLGALLLFVVGYVLATSLGLEPDIHLLMVVALALTIQPRFPLAWRFGVVSAASVASVLLFMKFVFGVAALLMILVATVLWLLRRAVQPRAVMLTVGLPFSLILAVLSLALVGAPADTVRWLGRSLEFTSGYSAAMSTILQPAAPLGRAFLGAALVATVVILVRRREPDLPLLAAALAPAMFVIFKQSFVRHGGYQFFPTLVAVVSVLVLGMTSRRSLLAGIVALSLMTGIVLSDPPWCRCPFVPSVALGSRGLTRIGELADVRATVGELAEGSREQLSGEEIPRSWMDYMRGGSVDVVPWEINLVRANALPWAPNPILQTYAAYTAELDRLSAKHFRDSSRPDFILAQFAEIDGRHPLLTTPSTWRTILRNYQPAPFPLIPIEGSSPVMLLERRSEPRLQRFRPVGHMRGQVGEWVPVPPTGGTLFAGIDLRQRLIGRLMDLVWRIDPVYIDVRFDDGSTATHRVIPDTAQNGLLVGPLPRNETELAGLLSDDDSQLVRARHIRIRGPGAASFESKFPIAWLELPPIETKTPA